MERGRNQVETSTATPKIVLLFEERCLDNKRSFRNDQGERIQDLLGMVPGGSSEAGLRTPRQVQHRLNIDEVDDLVRWYRAGAKVSELAFQFGVHRDTVSEILSRRQVVRHRQGIPPEFLDQTISDYLAGWSLDRLGARLAVDAGTVALALRKAGLKLRGPHDRVSSAQAGSAGKKLHPVRRFSGAAP